MEITFNYNESKQSYLYVVENNNGIFNIKSKLKGSSIVVYSTNNKETLEHMFLIDYITMPDGYDTISFKLDLPDSINVVLATYNPIKYAEVTVE